MKFRNIRMLLSSAMSVLLLIFHSSIAQAALVGITQDFPDINTDLLDISYTVSGGSPSSRIGTLTITSFFSTGNGSFFTYNDGSTLTNFDGDDAHLSFVEGTSGRYTLTASIQAQTGALLSGSFSMTGAIDSLGITDQNAVLLSGDLNAFGFAGSLSAAALDWTSDNITGALSSSFSSDVGGILHIQAGDFLGGSFSGTNMLGEFTASRVTADSFSLNPLAPPPAVVPVPAAIWLFGSGLLGLAGFLRRQKNNN